MLHSSAPTRRSLRARRRRSRLVAGILAPIVLLGGAGLTALTTTMAAAAALPAPSVSIGLQSTGGAHGDADEKPFILAGEDAVFDVSVTNASQSGDGFNTGIVLTVPEGVAFVGSGGMGDPVVFLAGEELPNSGRAGALATVPAGFQIWVFEDVADLPATATYASTVTVRPDAARFPVGSAPVVEAAGFVSADAALKPMFDGSTGRGAAAATAETSRGEDDASAPVRALRLTKSEPSPEIELLRGLHDHPTTYTLTVEHTPQGLTGDAVVVDHLPAGLEFLGCGDVDNTRDSALLHDGDREYPGAPAIGEAPPADCVLPSSVETVDGGLPAGLPAGVYTKVTWPLADLVGGTPQSLPTAPGRPGVVAFRYLAAVPLFENTMDFVSDDASGAPAPASLEQAANLNNNTGASTRHGQAAGYDDGIRYRNTASVSGDYAGPLATGTGPAVSDTDTEDVQAMDLRILKSVDTGAGDRFRTGHEAVFTLDIATSEYATAQAMTIVDTIPNGLCPILPTGTASTGDPLPADCAPDGSTVVRGATAASVAYDEATGEFAVAFAPDRDLVANDRLQIVYPVLMRASYDTFDPRSGSTSSGDTLTNEVEIEGDTVSVPALAGVVSGTGAVADGRLQVWDDSAAEILSGYSQISKQVLPRDAVRPSTTAADACDASGWAQHQDQPTDAPFHQGDAVCYELTVDFAQQIDVRNPKVTDFLPEGVEFGSWALADESIGLTADDLDFARDAQRLTWRVGTPDAEGDLIVPLGAKLVLHVLGTITEMTPATAAALDKPENLLKYQQENVLGEVFFLRDASAIQSGRGPTLVKGVRDVDGESSRDARSAADADGSVFASDRDGVQVAGGEVVAYRVDLTGGSTDVQDMVVWDALPEGIAAADVSGATAFDPADAGYPAGAGASGRSVVVWQGIDLAAGAQRTLDYDVTVPVGVLVNRTLVNTASITQYDVLLNTGEQETFYPEGSLDRTARDASVTVPGDGTRDDSAVFTPSPVVDKRIVETQVGPGTAALDPRNGEGDLVQGELVTYEYSVSIPAETTVRDAVLRDRGTFTSGAVPFTVTEGSWTGPAGVDRSAFTFEPGLLAATAPKGVLTFPSSYTNTTTQAQTFTVTLTGWVGDPGSDGRALDNEAQFRSASYDGSDWVRVLYREPALAIAKSASPRTDVAIGTPVEFTLRVTNANRVKSYDNTVVDTVPNGLIVDPATISGGGVLAGATATGGGTITWSIAEVPETAVLTYRASIDPTTGGGQTYRNTATVTGYTLPAEVDGESTTDRRGSRSSTANATITAATAGIAKGVRIADTTEAFAQRVGAPIGETVEYEVVVDLEPNINYYAPRIVDDLPAGVQLIDASIDGPDGIAGTWNRSHDAATNTTTWAFDGDILSSPTPRTVTLVYDVLLSDAVAPAITDLDNTASFSWNRVSGDGATRETLTDTAEVDVLTPRLVVDKSVSDAQVQPGETFDYTVVVRNTGSSPAHRMAFEDVVPAGVIVDAATISGGGALTGATATGGGTIRWSVDGPLGNAPGDRLAFTYSATIAASATLSGDDALTNTASVEHYESFPTGGREFDPTDVRDTATVTPIFPAVVLDKSTTAGAIAYEGESFGWTLTLRNAGAGDAASVRVQDVLPKHWSYDAGSATIARGTAAPVALADPTSATADDRETLVWSAAQTATALPGTASGAAEAARTLVIRFTATPSTEALVDAGVGSTVPHTNTLRAVVTDTDGAEGNGDGDYAGPQDTADARIHAADLSLTKEPGTTALVAGGAAGTAWTITVANEGPDPAVGPFTVTDVWGDAGVLPDGFAVQGFAGDGWTCAPTGSTGFTCETAPGTTLAAGGELPPITVTARVAASFDPADAPVANTAEVSGRTHDVDPSNDEDDAEVPVKIKADLEVEKTGPATAPNAGAPISWTIRAGNLGPADSVSSAAKPITVTDVIPAGVRDVTVGDLPTGWTASTDDALQPGDTLTLTLADGARLTPSASASFTLSGTVLESIAEGTPVVNEAVIAAGETVDPVEENDRDDTTTTPTIDTTLSVAKTRVVQQGGAWVAAGTLAEVPTVTAGASVTYLVTVANTGTADAREVTASDVVADYLAYSGMESVDGDWTRTSTTAAFGDDQAFALDGRLLPGASASFRVSFTVAPDHSGEVVNTATADARNATNEPDGTTDSGSERSANLSIAKSHSGDAVAGETLDYAIIVTNEGPSVADGPIVIDDLLPEGFGYVAGSATVSVDGATAVAAEPTVDGRTLTWSVGSAATSLRVDGTIAVRFTASVAADVVPGVLVNTATVTGPDDDDPSDDAADDPTTVVAEADTSIVKTVADGPHIAGEQVTYTLTVANAGPSVARDVVVADTLPPGLTLVSMSGAGWDCDAARCEIEVLPLGTNAITVVAQIDASVADGTELVNGATVTSSTPDADTTDNGSETPITVIAQADLSIVKTAVDAEGDPVAEAVAGEQVRYLLQVANEGPSDAVGPITVADALPSGFTFVTAEGDGWSCAADTTDATQLLCETPGGLAAGSSAEPLFVTVAIDPALAAGPATNTASVDSPTADPVPANDRDDAVVEVAQLIDLAIEKSHRGAVRIGDRLDFELQVTNAGPSTATAVTVVDALPTGLEFVDAEGTDEGWTVLAETDEAGVTTVTAVLADPLAPGASAPALVIGTTVLPAAYDTVTNTATVSGEQPETALDDNVSSDIVAVPAQASLQLDKRAVGALHVGDEAGYVITVTNEGLTEDPGPIVVSDVLPAGLRLVSAKGAGADCVSPQRTLECTIDGPLGVGASVMIELRVQVLQAAFPQVTNLATVSSPTEQIAPKLSASATSPVTADPLAETGGAWSAALAALVLLLLGGGALLLRRGRALR